MVPDMYGGYMPMPGGFFGRFWRMESTIKRRIQKNEWLLTLYFGFIQIHAGELSAFILDSSWF